MLGVMNGEFGLQSLDQFVAGQGAVMVGVVFQDHAGIAAMIILVARFFGGPQPGRQLVRAVSAAGGQRQDAKQDQG